MNIISAQATETQLAEAHHGSGAKGDLVSPGPGTPEISSQVDGNSTPTAVPSDVVSPVETKNPTSPAESEPAKELSESIYKRLVTKLCSNRLGILSYITHAV